jgi:hypothetical protein
VTTPRISIVMPTYNRRDTILRSVASVRAQSFADWELLVVDDGSTDGTADVLQGIDSRLRLIRQDNRGVAGARNTGLAAARGSLIAFLDSDDEWTPHHLGVATAFFADHPEEHAFTSEFWEDFGNQRYSKHFRVETGEWYPQTAARIGSQAFAKPPPEGDSYLWFYQTRSPPSARIRAVLDGTPHADALHYRGDIFRGWRWGWLMAMQPTVITRHALEQVGPCDTSYRIASDFGWLANVCRLFPMNLISAPGCIKHELADGRRPLAEGHLVTGRTATAFHEDVLRFHEELFWNAEPDDPELSALRGFRQSLAGAAALSQGARTAAHAHLEQAVTTYPGADTTAMLWLSRLPQDRLASAAARGMRKASWMAARIRNSLGARS